MLARLMSAAVSATTLVVLGLSGAQAAPPEFCAQYATAAINQVRIGLGSPACASRMEGARWSSDYRVHYDWCLSVPGQAAQHERDLRTGFINACR